MLRYAYTEESSGAPLPADLSETRFEQTGATFTQFLNSMDAAGVSGTLSGAVYTQSGDGFKATFTAETADKAVGGSEAVAFTFSRAAGGQHVVRGGGVVCQRNKRHGGPTGHRHRLASHL